VARREGLPKEQPLISWPRMTSAGPAPACARLCRDAGGEPDQIQFVLGHVSVQTTEKYLGCKQRLQNAVNDRSSPIVDNFAGRGQPLNWASMPVSGKPV
jgi:hypothetical protein